MKKTAGKLFAAVRLIPQGKVTTYGALAKLVGSKSPRPIGQILHQNPDPVSTPCHRVVFADGSLSSNYAFGGLKEQKVKLQQEGVIFLPSGKVDLTKSFHSNKSFSSFLRELT